MAYVIPTVVCVAINVWAFGDYVPAGILTLSLTPGIWLILCALIKIATAINRDDSCTPSNKETAKAVRDGVEKIIPHKYCPCCGGQFESTIVYTNSNFFKCEYCDTTFSYRTRATIGITQ